MRKISPTQIIFITFLAIILYSTQALAFSFQSFMNFFQSNNNKQVKVKTINRSIGTVKTPAHVKVGVYLLHVGKYDLQSATYSLDFYLMFKCDKVCQNINFEIMNATSSNIRLAAKQKGYLIYRIQANINKNNNLRNYPFDSHTLDIIIENRQMTNDKMIFEADPATTAIDSDLSVAGFYLFPTWSTNVSNHYYSVFNQTFSSYRFSMFVQRPWLAGLLKCILPAGIIVCCNFLALFMGIEHLSQRLGIATSTFIAAVVFHLNLTSSLPPLGYITFADTFMLLNYLCLLIVLVEVVVTTYFIDSKHRATAERVNTISAFAIPIFWFSLQLVNWLMFHPTAIPSVSTS